MFNPTGSTYVLQNAILRELAKPAAEQANVSIEKPATEYAAGKGASDAEAVRFATDLNFKKQALTEEGRQATAKLTEEGRQFTAKSAESDRQFLSQLLFAHDQLSTWSKQNDLATIISAAAIPGQIISMDKQSKSLDKQNELTQELINTNKANVERRSLADIALDKKLQDFLLNNPRAQREADLADLRSGIPLPVKY